MMIISISSVVSAGLAVLSYLKATQQAGTTQDADFFSLAQNSVMQVASIVIIMLSLRKTRFRDHARIYTWFLAIFGVISALVAIPVYILIPTGWSTLLSAASGISQSLVTLQLVYSLAAWLSLELKVLLHASYVDSLPLLHTCWSPKKRHKASNTVRRECSCWSIILPGCIV